MKVLLLALLVAFASAKVSYKGYQVWKVEIENEAVHSEVSAIVEQFNLDVWAEGKNWAHVMVTPTQQRVLWVAFSKKHIPFSTFIEDVGILAGEDKPESKEAREFDFEHYNTFTEIEAYLMNVSMTNPMADLESIGDSIEGRDLWAISFSRDRTLNKEAVYIDCGTHAREWVTVSTCLYGIDLFDKDVDAEISALLDRYDVYFVPVVNPDGYEYTWTDDRNWRKNRNPGDGLCYGVDLNRNFDDNFAGPGTSDQPCSDIYHGTSPASEPETAAVQVFLQRLHDDSRLNNMYSIHAYSQLWMWPYGNTTELCPDEDELRRVGTIGVNALTAVHNTKYAIGSIGTAIYLAAGTTVDYAYSQVGIRYSYTLEMRDEGQYGFLLPEDQIIPTAEETWAGLTAALSAAISETTN